MESPQAFTLDGKFYQAGTDNLLLDSAVGVRIQILNHVKTCLLYEEAQVVDTVTSAGNFSIQTGSFLGASKRTLNDPGLTMAEVVQNGSLITTGKLLSNLSLACSNASSLSALSRSVRYIRIYVDPSSAPEEVLTPDIRLESVPTALVSETLQGLGKSSFLQVSPSDNLSQLNLQSLFTGANFTKLTDLISGTSTQYVLSSGANFSPSGAMNFNSQRITNLASPTSGGDAANKTYVDGQIGGRSVSATISTLGAGDTGKVLTWTGAQWTASTVSTTDATKLPLAGGTMTGTITMDGNSIFNTGYITMAANNYLQLSSRTSTPAGLTSSHEGVMWYDSVADVIKYWDGDSAETVGTGTGTVTSVTSANGDISIATGTSTPVLTLNSGTAANQIVKLDGSSRLPAVDGSQLTGLTAAQIPNLDAAKITSGTIGSARLG
ncbi:MAG: hypothetical protein ACK5QX_10150, partial [bacterium]